MANNNYKSYSYIVNSPDYLEKLQEKIACYNDPHAQLLQKLENFAQFIISLAQQLQSIEEEIKRVVERVFLYLDLESQSTDILLALRNAGGRSEIIQFLKSINQTSAEAIMQEPEYRITIENKEATQMALLDNVATVSHFALVGGYLLVLKELEAVAGETIALQNVLLRGLGVSEENLIDKHSSELALRQLWAFTNEVPGLLDTKKLSVEAWISPEVCYSRINWQYINQEVFYQSQIDVRRDEESNAKDDINTFIST